MKFANVLKALDEVLGYNASQIRGFERAIESLESKTAELEQELETQRSLNNNLETDLNTAEDTILALKENGLFACDDLEDRLRAMAVDFQDYVPVDLFMEYGLHHYLPVNESIGEPVHDFDINFIVTG